MTPEEATVNDYIYCKDCKTFVDFWKFDCIEDTGHANCNWRFVTETELANLIEDCRENGCFDEVIL